MTTPRTAPDEPRPRAPRRPDALSRSRIVDAAIEILDADGEHALTARRVTDHLRTGRGGIYHHVSGMPDLLAAAAEQVVRALVPKPGTDPAAALRNLATGIFDAIGAHPWLGAQLVREPSQPAVLHIWTSIGHALTDLGLSGSRRSDAGAALANYVFGAAAQYGATAALARDPAARRAHLDALAETWIRHDDGGATREAAAHLREHDDREQFAAGLDIFLRGIRSDGR